MAQNLIYSINGPVVTIKGKTGLSMMEMVHVGNDHLVGEVIRMDEELTTIQVYEETSGLAPGEPVTTTGGPPVRYSGSRHLAQHLRRYPAASACAGKRERPLHCPRLQHPQP